MSNTILGVIQMACNRDAKANREHAEHMVRTAASQGADIILLPEMFESAYLGIREEADDFALGYPLSNHPTLNQFCDLAAELGVVLPLTIFERAGSRYYNTLVIIDADGSILGAHRKSHIPCDSSRSERFYFSAGDNPPAAFETAFGTLSACIGWEAWFAEIPRIAALQGACLMLCPSAHGVLMQTHDKDEFREFDASGRWSTVLKGHAASNLMAVAAANRIGIEKGSNGRQVDFSGKSSIIDAHGSILVEANENEEDILFSEIDVLAIQRNRLQNGLFNNRLPGLYKHLTKET